MKLFIWTGFCPDWTDGLAFAIAPNEKAARALVEKEQGHTVYEWGKLEVVPVNKSIARSVSGGG